MDSFRYGAPAQGGPRIGWRWLAGAGVALLVLTLFVGGGLLSRSGNSNVSAGASQRVGASPAPADPAADRQAESSLREARSTAVAAFVEGSSWAGAGAQQLSILDPSLTYVDGRAASTGPSMVSVEASSSGWAAASRSASGTCFYIHIAGLGGGTEYGSGSTCTGEAAMSASGAAW